MNPLLPFLIFKYYQISTSWRRRGHRIKNPIFLTMPKCESIPVGSVIRTGALKMKLFPRSRLSGRIH